MMEEILNKILSEIGGINGRLDGIDGRLDGIDGRLDGMDGRLDRMDSRLDGLEQEVSDLRHTQFIEMQGIKQELVAVRDTQTEALQRWNRSNELMERVEMLLDDHEAGKVAIEAKLVEHEIRITALEKVAV